MQLYEGKAELVKANDESPIFICTQCGECCHIREEKNITQEEEDTYRRYLFRHYGILCLASLAETTISLFPQEKSVLEEDARKAGISISIRPKRGIFDKKNHRLIILDYYLNHDSCPFFNAQESICTIYEDRPLICKSYPLTGASNCGKCRYKKMDLDAYGDEKIYAKSLEEKIKSQKALIKKLIAEHEIELPETISEQEFKDIVMTTQYVELIIE